MQPSLASPESRQPIRIKRLLLPAAFYLASIPLLWLASLVGMVSIVWVGYSAALMLAANVAFFGAIKSGFNLRWTDKNFALAQTLTAITLIMFVAYGFDRNRAVVLVWLLIVLLFGVFRFKTREFVITAMHMLLGYAVVINLLMYLRPSTVDVYTEWYLWVWLAVILPAFAVIGGKISEMRARLVNSNQDLLTALSTIQDMATHDSLTNLPNRVLFNDTLHHALSRAERSLQPLSLFFIDLDHFKNINDTMGHPVGDDVLRETARRLLSTIRESDMLARLGGDEFVLLVEDTAKHDALVEIATKLMTAVSAPLNIRGQEISFTASVGIASYPVDGKTASALLANADLAMYKAKEQGRGRVCFFVSEMGTTAAERFSLEASLRLALDRNELRIHYQPKIDIPTSRIVGVEALIRWQHPEQGMLSPDKFITIAEETGLIIPIGLWTIRTACAAAARWRSAGLRHLTMAVNLSTTQFAHDDLAQDVARILRETSLPPQFLELEITESMLMRNPERAVSVIGELRRIGIRLAIDDFGTGYSSLAYLKQFPVDTLKVDRAFVRDLPHSRDDIAITRAVIAMAHSLNMSVVAEGVEEKEQLDALRTEGCDEFQGFFCRPALTEEDFLHLIQNHKLAPMGKANGGSGS